MEKRCIGHSDLWSGSTNYFTSGDWSTQSTLTLFHKEVDDDHGHPTLIS